MHPAIQTDEVPMTEEKTPDVEAPAGETGEAASDFGLDSPAGRSPSSGEGPDGGSEGKAPAWQKTVTVLVYLLAVVAFLAIGRAYLEQRSFNRLMDDLFSADDATCDAAAKELATTDGCYPYLCTALVRRYVANERALCADVILRRLEARDEEGGSFADEETRMRHLRAGLDLEAISAALSDECPDVRYKAMEIIRMVGLEQNYQRTRRDEMVSFEALLGQLAASDAKQRASAAEAFREAGIRALPYLVGVVFARDNTFTLEGRNVLQYDDVAFRRRGLTVLRTIVTDVLKGSNQRRIVLLLGRRRCRLLLAELARFETAEDRKVLTDILNVSNRLPGDFFPSFLTAYAQADAGTRETFLTDRVLALESDEKVRRKLPEKVKKALE